MSRPGTTDVAVFVPGLAAGGGAEKTALVMAEALARAGLGVTCFTDPDVSLEQLRDHFGLELADIRLRGLPSPATPARLPRALRELARDRAHARTIRAAAPGLFVNMKFKSELPGLGARNWYYVHFPHRLDVVPRSSAHARYLRAVATLRRLVLHRRSARFTTTYDRVLANSDFTRSHVLERWRVEATVLHPPCASVTSGSDESPATERAASVRDRTILNVGRFQADGPTIPHKRQDVLVETFAGMADLIADGWSLQLVGAVGGSTDDRAFLDRVRELAEGLPVSVHANAPHEQLSELSGRARIYWHAQGFGTDDTLHPEAQEHFGISTVEAMAAGIVPLVYATAGPAEVVQDEAELTWRTPAELADRTRALLDATRWAYWSHRCRERAADFSTEAFTTRLLELYRTDGHRLPGSERGRR